MSKYRIADIVCFANAPGFQLQEPINLIQEAVDGKVVHVAFIIKIISLFIVEVVDMGVNGFSHYFVDLSRPDIAVVRIKNRHIDSHEFGEVINRDIAARKEAGRNKYSFFGVIRLGLYKLLPFIKPVAIVNDAQPFCSKWIGEILSTYYFVKFRDKDNYLKQPEFLSPNDIYISNQVDIIKDFG